MFSKVQICNMALSHLRAAPMADFEELTTEAQACRTYFDVSMNMILERHPWSFANMVKPLVQVSDQQLGWNFTYAYPLDCMRINLVRINWPQPPSTTAGMSAIARRMDDDLYDYNNPPRVEYEVRKGKSGARVIVSNDPNLLIDYQTKSVNLSDISSTLAMALSHMIASNIATLIAGIKDGPNLAQENLQKAGMFISEAMVNDMRQQYDRPAESEYVTVRR